MIGMSSKRARIIALVAGSILLTSGCGAPLQTRAIGLEQTTKLSILGKDLSGAIITINGVSTELGKANQIPFTMGVAGSKDSPRQQLESYSIEVAPGKNKVTLRLRGQLIFEDELYLSDGQMREIAP